MTLRASWVVAALGAVSVGCQPTYGFRFLNPTPARHVVRILEAERGDTAGPHDNRACARMRGVRLPVGTVDTVHVMPDSSRTWMIALGSGFSPEARYCLIVSREGSRTVDTLYLTGATATRHARNGVLTVELHPAVAVVRRTQ